MDDLTPLNVLFRWIHVGTAIVVLGGSVFMRFVLMPAAAALPDAEHDALRQRVMGRWKKFVMIGIFLFLVSGFYNYLVVSIPAHKVYKLYHPLIGTKILLAFVVFFLASALTGRSVAFEGIRKNNKKWLLITIALAAIIVAISGVLKIAFPPK
jgi:uncharacterized membrane protein